MPREDRTGAESQYVLLVMRDGVLGTHPLPVSGSVLIGRAPECDIIIDDPSISRRHTLLHVGPPLAIEDMGSANGTRVHDALLLGLHSPQSDQTAKTAADDRLVAPGERFEIVAGKVIRLGAATLIVQERSAQDEEGAVASHAEFEQRLEEACVPASARDPFAIVRLRVDPAADLGVVERLLSSACGPADVVAVYAPADYELLLWDRDASRATAHVQQLLSALAGHGVRASAGLALHPDDGQSSESLLSIASARLRSHGEEHAPPVVVHDPAMIAVYQLVERVAASNISVLLLGESGVGKEVLAERIWRLSARANSPMLRLNCAALSESLLESELFGHERGAFTGAVRAKKGLLESAEGGVIFLDEIGELPLSTQVKLLRVIEERRVLPVGALAPRAIDVRFVSATNRDLERDVAAGRFREDLFYRINGFSIAIPPLRERAAEIEPLARAFITHFCRQERRPREPRPSAEALQLMRSYRWPGNVRELRNVVERALVLCGGADILPEHLPVEKMSAVSPSSARAAGSVAFPTLPPTAGVPADSEEERILAALTQCAGNQTRAAKLLGISRGTLVSRLARYSVPRPRK
jgi:DNA-binding NtrC family response regulator